MQSVRKRSFSGDDRFAEIYFEREELTVMLREDQLEGTVRPPIAATKAHKVLDHLKTWQGKVSKSWKARANAHEKKLEKGEAEAYAEVYKNLRKQEQNGKLSVADRKHLKMSRRFLAEELANALDKSVPQAKRQMSEAVRS